MKFDFDIIFKRPIRVDDFEENDKLPLMYSGLYNLYRCETNEQEWLTVEVKNTTNLAIVRKHQRQLEKLTGLHCVLYFNKLNAYSRERMLEEGIPFIVGEKQVYMPFMGVALSSGEDRILKPVNKISFLTQKMLLLALYEKWDNVTVTAAADKLGVTKMSVSRCFDEIEYLELPIMGTKGKSRTIYCQIPAKEMWQIIQPVLRNPVIAEYELKDDIITEIKAGISALSEYSLLEDNIYPTYAITKKDLQKYPVNQMALVPKGEEKGCVVQEIGYYINFNNKNVLDPLSVYLELKESDMAEERVQIAVDRMLEEYVW